jgi:hypothetical protein
MFISAVGMFAVFLFLTYYLQRSLGYSAVMTGVAFLPMTGSLVVVTSIISTVLVHRVSARVLIPSGMAVSALAMYLLTNIGLSSSYAGDILPSLVLLGVGLGLVFAPGFGLGTFGVQASDSGVASATINTMQQVGGSVGTALLNTIAASAATSYVTSHAGPPLQLVAANAAIHSYTTAFWWAAGIFAVGALLVAVVLGSGVTQPDPDAAAVVVH